MHSSSITGGRVEALRRQHSDLVEVVIWVLVWLVISPLVIASIKILTSGTSLNFPFPWMLVGFTNVGVWVFCHALQLVPGRWQQTGSVPVTPWKYAATLGALQGFEVGLAADIIKRISLTLRTEINMLCPAFMFLFGLAAGIEVFDPRLALSVGVVTVGGLLASYGLMTWEGIELVPIAILASGFSAVRWVLTQKWLSPSGEGSKPSPIVLALRMSPMTSFVGFAVAAVREPAAYRGLMHLPYPGKVAALLCLIAFLLCFMIVAEMRVVQLTSALLLGFLVPFHNVSVILLDVTMKGTKTSAWNWMGIVMCAVASGFYSIARKEDKYRDPLVSDVRAAPAYQSTAAGVSSAAPEEIASA